MPWERGPILDFMIDAARSVPQGSRVLDVGAGDAPYAELFAHTDYVTLEWEGSPHAGGRTAAITASADAMPLREASFDVVLLTQVLEHVLRPAAVLTEIARVLRPGGTLFATVPFAWELHEEPHDYWRFTQYALAALLEDAGFTEHVIEPRSDSLSALAQLMTNIAWSLRTGNADARSVQASDTCGSSPARWPAWRRRHAPAAAARIHHHGEDPLRVPSRKGCFTVDGGGPQYCWVRRGVDRYGQAA